MTAPDLRENAHPRPRTTPARSAPARSIRATRRVLASALAVAALAAVSACGSGTSAATTPTTAGVIDVVAGENPWGDVVRQIGGDHVRVTSIIKDPSTDPHEYESDPRDAAAVARARLVVLNGAGYDDFASKLLKASPSGTRTVLTAASVVHLTGSDANPHLWYDPAYVTQVAAAVTARLSRISPSRAADFQANEKTFLAAYQPYRDAIAKIRAEHAGARVAYTERVPGYLVQAAGLELGTPAGFSRAVEDDTDPSAADARAFEAAVTGGRVAVLLYNGQVTDAQTARIKALATSSGVPVVGVTETIPSGEHDFQTWQTDQADQILKALGG